VLFGVLFGFFGGFNNFGYSSAFAMVSSQVTANSLCSHCQQVVIHFMLKTIGKFEDLFIVNIHLFIDALLNDFKSHVRVHCFERCNNAYRM
jgi:hypothetical protein